MRASCMNFLSGRTTGNLLYCTFAESKQCQKGLGLSCFLSVHTYRYSTTVPSTLLGSYWYFSFLHARILQQFSFLHARMPKQFQAIKYEVTCMVGAPDFCMRIHTPARSVFPCFSELFLPGPDLAHDPGCAPTAMRAYGLISIFLPKTSPLGRQYSSYC